MDDLTLRIPAAMLAVMLWSPLALGQSPEPGRFDYVLYDNGDQQVGNYFFTSARAGGGWRAFQLAFSSKSGPYPGSGWRPSGALCSAKHRGRPQAISRSGPEILTTLAYLS